MAWSSSFRLPPLQREPHIYYWQVFISNFPFCFWSYFSKMSDLILFYFAINANTSSMLTCSLDTFSIMYISPTLTWSVKQSCHTHPSTALTKFLFFLKQKIHFHSLINSSHFHFSPLFDGWKAVVNESQHTFTYFSH